MLSHQPDEDDLLHYHKKDSIFTQQLQAVFSSPLLRKNMGEITVIKSQLAASEKESLLYWLFYTTTQGQDPRTSCSLPQLESRLYVIEVSDIWGSPGNEHGWFKQDLKCQVYLFLQWKIQIYFPFPEDLRC